MFDKRTRATLRKAEFGFFGVVVYTRVHTPRRCGHESKAGDLDFHVICSRPLRTNCEIVGILCWFFQKWLYHPKNGSAKIAGFCGNAKIKREVFSIIRPYDYLMPSLAKSA
jgi:hypothetical protein